MNTVDPSQDLYINMKNKLDKNEMSLEYLENQIDKLKETSVELNSTFKRSVEELNMISNFYKNLEKENSELWRRIENVGNEIKSQKEKLNDLHTTIQRVEIDSSEMDHKIGDLENRISKMEHSIGIAK